MVVDGTTPNLHWVRCFSKFCNGFLTLNLGERKARFEKRTVFWPVSQFSAVEPPRTRHGIGGSSTPGFSSTAHFPRIVGSGVSGGLEVDFFLAPGRVLE